VKYIALVVVALTLAACSGPDMDREMDELARTREKLVARVEVEPSHFVSFYELAPGQIAILEEGSLDARVKPLDRNAWTGRSMAELHEMLAPGAPVPERLWMADQRRVALLEYAAQPPRLAPGLHEVREPDTLTPQAVGASELVERASWTLGREVKTPPGDIGTLDAASDAAWWQANFCTWSQVDSVWCPTNVGWAHSGWRPTMYYEAAGMSASSIASATFWVDQYTTSWVRVFTANANPRTWWKWSWAVEGTFRSGVDGLAPQPWVHFAERFRHAITGFTHYNYFPYAAEWQFNNDIQGVTHDASNWYFTRTIYPIIGTKKGVVAKASVGYNLNNEPSIRYEEPSAMLNAGYNHFGDLTQRSGLLYIGIDGSSGGGVAVWSTDIRYYVGWVDLPGLSGCPWIAYNPRDNLFYVPDGSRTLRRYSIAVGSSITATEVLPRITLSADITSQQGGEFSSRGILYIARGYESNPMAVYGVDIYSGLVFLRASYNGTPASDWEGEGVTIWDLTAGQAPGISGHMHFQLLDNDLDNDDFSFAHLTAVDPARL